MLTQHARIILGSGSAARRALLERAGIAFEVIASDVDEDAIKKANQGIPPAGMGVAIARAKAFAVSELHPDAYVIAGDQICAMGKEIFDKPGTPERAVEQLMTLQGKTHQQHSAMMVAFGGQILMQNVDTATLTMRPLTQAQAQAYVAEENPVGAAGSYHFEGKGRWLFSKVEGADATIQGLPIIPLMNYLLEKGVVTF